LRSPTSTKMALTLLRLAEARANMSGCDSALRSNTKWSIGYPVLGTRCKYRRILAAKSFRCHNCRQFCSSQAPETIQDYNFQRHGRNAFNIKQLFFTQFLHVSISGKSWFGTRGLTPGNHCRIIYLQILSCLTLLKLSEFAATESSTLLW
jgi:hypothetical protein